MKHQALFPYKDKSQKIKCRLLQFGALRVKWLAVISFYENASIFSITLSLDDSI